MAETKMPAAEAAVADTSEMEHNSYELAFHVLPTVAEGEVAEVFSDLKQTIIDHQGEVFDEEAPERFDLAYEIVQHIENKNRKFSSAYFGWVRFKMTAPMLVAVTAEVEARTDILRYMVLKLTKVEEANPYRFHEAIKDEKMVTNVEDSKVIPDTTTVAKEETAEEKKEEAADVDEGKLDEALEKAEVAK